MFEAHILHSELWIKVTGFFKDTEAFDKLPVIGKYLFKNYGDGRLCAK
jgi:hypothetical protein